MGRSLARLTLFPLVAIAAIALSHQSLQHNAASAQAPPQPSVVDLNLGVRTFAAEFEGPIGMAFLAEDEYFVLEKATGRVWRVIDGARTVALDLSVNSASERGLLSIALHPDFPDNPSVYLYWTESSTGQDSAETPEVPLLANRVDRYEWNGTTLNHAAPIIALRARQADAGQPERGNHNGGVIRFGPDGKLYIVIGDVGRRGWLQNLLCGPTPTCPGNTVADDQFGGPMPDDAHLTGVILRLNADGTTPSDNPLVAAGAAMGGEAGENIQKVFAYGLRNTFGMAFDPVVGDLWLQENGDDSFSELNRVEPGLNGGWIQVMGPIDRIAQFKATETSDEFFGLQQIRWPPTLIAESPAEAALRLVMFEGAHYSDPELSWRFEIAPAAMGFLESSALGPQYRNDLFLAASRPTLAGGYLFHFNLTGNRRMIGVDDPRLGDRVADNLTKFDITESEQFLFGRNFGIGTDVLTGPNGNLFVVSLSNQAIYEIFRR